MSQASPRGTWRPYLFAFLYGLFVALCFALVIYPMQGTIDAAVDLNGFGELSRNIAEGVGFSFNYGPTVRRAPLYPAIGATMLYLFGSPATGFPDAEFYRPIIIANCLFVGLTSATIWHIGSQFERRVGILAVVIAPLIPQSIRYVGMTEVETLMGLLIALLAATGIELVKGPSLKTGAAFGVTVALATLTKPVVMLYPFAFFPFAVIAWRRRGLSPKTMGLVIGTALACFVALLLPWSIRNAIVTNGKFKGISSNAPGEFLRGYVNAQPKYYLLRQDFGGNQPNTEKWDPEANLLEEKVFRERGSIYYSYRWNSQGRTVIVPTPPPGVGSAELELERDRIESAEIKQRVLENPLGFVHKFVVQLATFWYIVETRTKSVLVGGIALVSLAFATLGYLSARSRNVVVWPIALVLAYFNAIYAAFLAFARYSMPLYPTLAILISAGLVAAVRLLQRRLAPASS
jgi:4-amino-4-deoxy-L-arabinose transferase-like glycosyltransferase